MPCTRHRVFLATLIVAAKYLNDCSPKNGHWQRVASMWKTSDINIMEGQLLCLLDYNLRFTEAEACRAFAPFMSTDALAREASNTRASAVNKVLKAGRVRAQQQAQAKAQAQAQLQLQAPPTPPPELPPLPQRVVQVRSPTLVPKRVSAGRLSAHKPLPTQRTPAVPPLMCSAVSTDSLSSSSSSDIASLLEDTGSSSSSSSGWTTPEDAEYSEDERAPGARVYEHCPQGSGGLDSGDMAAVDAIESVTTTTKKLFISHPAPLPVSSYVYKHLPQHAQQQNRTRKPSDTSSVHTITASSPHGHSHLSVFARRTSKRAASVSILHGDQTKDYSNGLSASTTMPSIPSSGSTSASRGGGGFLSRMWAATKGQSHDVDARGRDKDKDKDKDKEGDCTPGDKYGHGTGANLGHHHHHGQNAFRRLVYSAHGVSRGVGRGAGWSQEEVVGI